MQNNRKLYEGRDERRFTNVLSVKSIQYFSSKGYYANYDLQLLNKKVLKVRK